MSDLLAQDLRIAVPQRFQSRTLGSVEFLSVECYDSLHTTFKS